MNEIMIKTCVLGIVMTNCYIVHKDKSKEAVVIDPGAEVEKILNYLRENDLECNGILLTHGHFDHIMAAGELAKQTGATIYAHEAELELLQDPNKNCSTHIRAEYRLRPDVLMKDDDILTIAGFEIKVIHTPGHTIGGVCYYFHGYGVMMSGDTLFSEDIGRTDLPTGNGQTLIDSILDKLMVFEDNVKVYPGHGEPTFIGHERENNIYLSKNPNNPFLSDY